MSTSGELRGEKWLRGEGEPRAVPSGEPKLRGVCIFCRGVCMTPRGVCMTPRGVCIVPRGVCIIWRGVCIGLLLRGVCGGLFETALRAACALAAVAARADAGAHALPLLSFR